MQHRIGTVIFVFCICLAVHTLEVCILRTDETVFAECFVNKVFGILTLYVLLHLLHVVSATGVDELQILRVLIGELTSFLAVALYIRKKEKNR